MPAASAESDAQRAVELAAELLQQAIGLQTPQERRQQAELDRLIGHEGDKATLVEMTDQAFRTHTPARVADQLTHLLDVQGIPRFFSPMQHAMLRGFQSFGAYLPGVAVPLVKEKMRHETANVILPAERDLLAGHLRRREQQGVQMNVNLLGEALLGEEETHRRQQAYFDALRMPELRCLSVKISTLYSQIAPIARQHTVDVVSDRLETLYRTALAETDPVTGHGKFVYLDMEEYRDLYLTADVLIAALGRPGLEQARAGIALQAYVPDSFRVLQRLIEWSARRVQRGGEPLTIRLVKGANLEMERVEASIGGHPQAPFRTKLQTDANFKRMLRESLPAAAKGEVHVGVASHNLFDVALALIWTKQYAAAEHVQIEMLEGMANHQRRALASLQQRMLLYAPACNQEDFLYAITYLIRRLDENTGPHNFLRHAYRLKVGTPEFDKLADDFYRSLSMIDQVDDAPRRTQDRRQPPEQPPAAEHWTAFANEPDTDWSLPHNADWIAGVLEDWKRRCDDRATVVPLFLGEQRRDRTASQLTESFDPSRPGVVACRYAKATVEEVREAVSIADRDASGWRRTGVGERHRILREAAQGLRCRRGDLIAAMMADGGKTVAESDPEVSEAIDFTEFYPLTACHWSERATIQTTGRGVVAVIPPWNFPLAIPCGGVAASLAAGNSVVLKPASETVLPAFLACEAFWEAGVPRDALQLMTCDDEVAEAGLVKNERVETVVLTGGTATAQRMLSVRPRLHLIAETGGKNATIVTAMADRELAVKHVVHSAFSHSGQKCSATSLLLLQDEVFHDEKFRRLLADAVESLPVGSAWDLTTRINPLIAPPGAALTRGMQVMEDEEWWLVPAEHVVGNPNLYRPGVKWDVQPGSFAHTTELFGPVLSVMRFSRLEEAIGIVRSTGYGLTSGLESLDDREIELWKETIGAGNLYINRGTTGAVVLRQPFGGVGLSSYGPGAKAGSPNYVLGLMNVRDGQQPDARSSPAERSPVPDAERSPLSPADPPAPADRLLGWLDTAPGEVEGLDESLVAEMTAALQGQREAARDVFSREHDTFRLVGQDNLRRYRPIKGMSLRVTSADQIRDAWISLTAGVAVGTQVTVSIEPAVGQPLRDLLEAMADELPGLIHPLEESAAQLARRMQAGEVSRLRLLTPDAATAGVRVAAAEAFVTLIGEPVVADGRVESLRYLHEQSISHDYHRYGNLGRRADERRSDVL